MITPVLMYIGMCILAMANCQSIQVTTMEGIIEGYAATDGNYYAFHGIPYAMSRLGLDMFKPSTPPSALPGLFYANNSGIQCAHPSPDGMIGILDCLIVNVFTSNVTASNPVLVWLNGEESNPTVSSQYSFKRLIDEDLVVVTLNYRLSVFGFLCLRTGKHNGNAGLKDIILGLQWIQRNIAVFGGDPNNVILMGHGSAAAIVDFITLTRETKNLVHKAIALSGSAIAPWAASYDPLGAALTLNSVTGGVIYERNDIAASLSSMSLHEINNALNQFKYTNNTQMFALCIENTNTDFLIYVAPIYMYSSINHRDIPYIAGYMTKEGTQKAREAVFDGWLQKMQTDFKDFLPVDLDFGNNKASQAESIRNFYFKSDPISSIDSYLNYFGDTMVVVSTIRGLRLRARSNRASDVFLLEFGYIGTKAGWNFNEPLNGARHGSILNYIFDFDLTSYDEYVANSIVKRISAFAYTGNPTPNGTTFPVWRPFTNESSNYLSYFGSSESSSYMQETKIDPQEATMSFWDPLYDTYYVAPSSAAGMTGLISVVLLSFILLTIV